MHTVLVFLSAGMFCGITMAAALPQGNGPAAPGTIDLRPRFEQWKLSIKRQGGRGTCSVFAVTGAMEYALSKRADTGVQLSEEFLNWAKNKAANRHKDGDFFDQIWHGYEQYGICERSFLPYGDTYNPDLEPPAEALANAKLRREPPLSWHWIKPWDVKTGLTTAELDSIKETLRLGWPVCGGLRWPKKASYTQDVLDMRTPDAVFDGHSVLIVGYTDSPGQPGEGTFLYRDSNSGEYARMPYAYAADYMNDAGWID